MDVLLLSDDQIKSLLTPSEVIETVEKAFREKGLGNVQMPAKTYLYLKKHHGDLRTMPSYIETEDICGVKIVNVYPDNPKHGLPSVAAVIILIDPNTGLAASILNGTWITAVRTAAAAAVATKYLARKSSTTLSLVGAGVQASAQLMMITNILKIHEVRVYDIRPESTEQFVRNYNKKYGFKFVVCRTLQECVKGADVLCTTTPSTSPLIMNNWIEDGQHINAIGADAPGKEELDPEILKRSKIVVDDIAQAIHSGEINVPMTRGIITQENIYGEIGEIITASKKGRISEDEITVFDSTGLSIQDVSTAALAYDKARAANIGTQLSF